MSLTDSVLSSARKRVTREAEQLKQKANKKVEQLKQVADRTAEGLLQIIGVDIEVNTMAAPDVTAKMSLADFQNLRGMSDVTRKVLSKHKMTADGSIILGKMPQAKRTVLLKITDEWQTVLRKTVKGASVSDASVFVRLAVSFMSSFLDVAEPSAHRGFRGCRNEHAPALIDACHAGTMQTRMPVTSMPSRSRKPKSSSFSKE